MTNIPTDEVFGDQVRDVIQLYDFYDNYYEIDRSGKLIKEIPSNNE